MIQTTHESSKNYPVLTLEMIDELTAILAVPDPKPSEPWAYTTFDGHKLIDKGPLKSVSHVHDLLECVPDGGFIIIIKLGLDGIYTQAWREGRVYQTECSVPNEIGNLIYQFHTVEGGDLPLALAYLVMGSYVRLGGRLPEWEGPEPKKLQFGPGLQ